MDKAMDAGSYAVKMAADTLAKTAADHRAAVDDIDAARADVLDRDRLDRLDTALGEIKSRLDAEAKAAQRPHLGRAAVRTGGVDAEHKAAFVDGYIRRGFTDGLQSKSLNAAVPAEGGFAVPQQIDTLIEKRLRDISPIRSVAQVVQVGSSGYRKLVASAGLTSGWAGEIAARPETATTIFSEVVPPSGDLYANPAATQAMLDDAVFDVESWLADEISREFAQKEGAAFISGTGVARPKGFLTYATATTADSTRPFGTLQYVPTGVAGAFAGTNPADKLIDLIHTLRPAYRQGAVFVMNSKTLSQVRKFKDSTGQFLWQPSVQAGVPASLLGYSVIEAEDMPDVAADSLSIAFGNFNAGYVIADRAGVRILRDPYTNKPYVYFYATKRTGGAVTNSEAIKLMKFGVS
jgi:HK97 family phage major capsid protein